MAWNRKSKTQKTTFFYYESKSHDKGEGFPVNDNIIFAIKIFVPINDRICYIVAKGKWFDIAFINYYASTVDKDNETKNDFYSRLETVYESIPSNVIKVVLGDFNAKVGREQWFRPVIGNESLDNTSNDNEERLISFTMTRDMTISST